MNITFETVFTGPLTVEVGHVRNPDIQTGGYWQEPVDPAKRQRIPVKTLAEAVTVCMDFISRNGLGGGNWNAGTIREGSKKVAKVSYNRRLWTMDEQEIVQPNVKSVADCNRDGWR